MDGTGFLTIGPHPGEVDFSKPMPGPLAEQAAFAIRAFMVWPNDETKRRQFLAQALVAKLAALDDSEERALADGCEAAKAFLSVAPQWRYLFQECYFPLVGGWRAFNAGPSIRLKELNEAMRRGYIAGTVLMLREQLSRTDVPLPDGPSINLATAILVNAGLPSINADIIGKAWRGHRSVAHLFAALQNTFLELGFVMPFFGVDRGRPYGCMGSVLSRARNYQEFLTSQRSRGQKESFPVWKIPAFWLLPKVGPIVGAIDASDVQSGLAALPYLKKGKRKSV